MPNLSLQGWIHGDPQIKRSSLWLAGSRLLGYTVHQLKIAPAFLKYNTSMAPRHTVHPEHKKAAKSSLFYSRLKSGYAFFSASVSAFSICLVIKYC
jgi:hypothetical protein